MSRAALAKAKRHGCRLFMHTNQSGVGRGYFAMDRVNAVNDEMYRLMGLGANPFDAVCIAPDDPSAPLTPSSRKPNPRFELEMIEKYGLDSHLEKTNNIKANHIRHLLGIANFIVWLNPHDQEARNYIDVLKKYLK